MDAKVEIKIITGEMDKLTQKWKGVEEPEFMSNEYIDRRFDRIRYIKLKKRLNEIKAKNGKKDNYEVALDIFNEKGETP